MDKLKTIKKETSELNNQKNKKTTKNITQKKYYKADCKSDKKHVAIKFNNFLLSIKAFFKKNFKILIPLLTVFVLVIVSSNLIFKNNQYYLFLTRPKIIQHPETLMCLIIVSVFIVLIDYFLNFIVKQKRIKIKKLLLKNNNLKLRYAKTQMHMSKLLKQKNNHKRKSNTYITSIVILSFILLLNISFALKALGLCVMSTFFIILFSVVNIINKTNIISRLTSIIILLSNFLVFLSFYLIFLLN